MDLKTNIRRHYYMFKESKFYIRNKNRFLNFLKFIIPTTTEVLVSSTMIWLTLNLFNIIQLTKMSFIQCIALYFIIAEIRYNIFSLKTRGK